MVERLWRVGYLTQYIRATDSSTVRRVSAKEPTRGIIRVIHGNSNNTGTSSRRKRRKFARTAAINERKVLQVPTAGNNDLPIDAPITFPPLNEHRVVAPHDDALVLTLSIRQFDVQRILVDPGSSADLIQALALRQMGHSINDLVNPGRILSGFNGATTHFLGDIILPVRAGPVTLNVKFSVMEDLSLYNVILGRTWLHSMKAVPSTYHQMVSYVTKAGQVNLLGNQFTSRQCTKSLWSHNRT